MVLFWKWVTDIGLKGEVLQEIMPNSRIVLRTTGLERAQDPITKDRPIVLSMVPPKDQLQIQVAGEGKRSTHCGGEDGGEVLGKPTEAPYRTENGGF